VGSLCDPDAGLNQDAGPLFSSNEKAAVAGVWDGTRPTSMAIVIAVLPWHPAGDDELHPDAMAPIVQETHLLRNDRAESGEGIPMLRA